jgi:DNA invertase Pin-like site-specific DNA recombinase
MLRPMVGAVIYVRVSDPRQAKNLSLGTQLSSCEDYCRREGYEILERFKEEGESAKTADRTELIKLLTYCRKNKGKVHFVVVHNLTRFAREKFDHFSLRAHPRGLGISLRSATEPIDDSATGKLVDGVLASVAQFDNDVRSDQTRAGMVAALKMGRWTFLAPIGYLNAPRWAGQSLIHDLERAPLIQRAFEDLWDVVQVCSVPDTSIHVDREKTAHGLLDEGAVGMRCRTEHADAPGVQFDDERRVIRHKSSRRPDLRREESATTSAGHNAPAGTCATPRGAVGSALEATPRLARGERLSMLARRSPTAITGRIYDRSRTGGTTSRSFAWQVGRSLCTAC